MSTFRFALKDKRLHLSAWLLCIPGMFFTPVLAYYLGHPGSLGDAFRDIMSLPYFVAFLVPWSVVLGYIEAWLVLKKVKGIKERNNGNTNVTPA